MSWMGNRTAYWLHTADKACVSTAAWSSREFNRDCGVAAAGGKVLVHCRAGISRSASVVIGYCMWKDKLTAKAATLSVRQVREVVWPNPGFKRQLEQFESISCDATKWGGWSKQKFLQLQYDNDSLGFISHMLGDAVSASDAGSTASSSAATSLAAAAGPSSVAISVSRMASLQLSCAAYDDDDGADDKSPGVPAYFNSQLVPGSILQGKSDSIQTYRMRPLSSPLGISSNDNAGVVSILSRPLTSSSNGNSSDSSRVVCNTGAITAVEAAMVPADGAAAEDATGLEQEQKQGKARMHAVADKTRSTMFYIASKSEAELALQMAG
eukprot:GHRR01009176.1.p1 GENE.GHRR01009176.1~~GHRR01009176.1.p1  ORF type:complete len:325 (+),score=116.85 GHRR01009176.1:219-1193(+)